MTDPLEMTADQLSLDFDPAELVGPEVEPEAAEAPKIPGYRLLERLEGGAWRARQVSTGQAVMVKVFERLDPPQLRKLEQLVRLGSHPYLINVIDAQLEHQPPYLVTSLLRGSLAAWMKVHAHAAELNERVSNWLQQAAHGLSFVHRRRLIHGALGPRNLLLDSREALRLAEFGQPYRLEQRREELFLLAPEQVRQPRAPQAGWDLYALGATFYYLLTSFYPRASFKGLRRLEVCADYSERLREYWILAQSSRLVPVLDYNPNVQVRLAVIIERCLAVDPAARYAQAADLLADLELRDQVPEHGLDNALYSLRRLTYRLGL